MMPTAAPPFRYAPLYGNEIRLLRLPLDSTAPFPDYTLIHVPLDAAGHYEAISYTWDGDDATSEISLNGEQFFTTVKVQRLLRALDSATTAKRVWIDFVCINQKDLDERSRQVPLMRDIFAGAVRVTAWLGHRQDAVLAKEMVADILAHTRRVDSKSGIYASYSQSTYRTRLLALKTLLRNRWFRRMWVIQEVVVAKDVNIVYGGETFVWKELVQVSKAISSSHEFLAVLQGTADAGMTECDTDLMFNCELTNNIRAFYAASNPWPLSLALDTGRKFQATDPRDMVFAALGFTIEATNLSLAPDYTKTAEDVFINAARVLYSSQEALAFTLSLLLPCAGKGLPRKLTNMPSWVPDWSGNTLIHGEIQTLGSLGAYEATLDSQPAVEIMAESNVMKVQGLCVDEIVEVGNVYDIPFNSDMSISRVDSLLYTAKWHHEVLDIARRRAGSLYATDVDLENAIWKTLACNLDLNKPKCNASDELGTAYLAWKRSLENYLELEKKYDRNRIVAALNTLYGMNSSRVRGESTSKPFFELAGSAARSSETETESEDNTRSDDDISPFRDDNQSGWKQVDRIITIVNMFESIDKFITTPGFSLEAPQVDTLRLFSIMLVLFVAHDVNDLENRHPAIYHFFERLEHDRLELERLEHAPEPVLSTDESLESPNTESPGVDSDTENEEVQPRGFGYKHEQAENEEEYEPKRLERVMSVLTTLASINLKSMHASTSEPQPGLQSFPMENCPDPEILFSMYNAAIRPSYMRSFFATRGGYIGMGPAYSKPGDRVCLIMGLNAPYVVRMTEGGDTLRGELVGEAYVHGMMDGEMMEAGEVGEIYLV